MTITEYASQLSKDMIPITLPKTPATTKPGRYTDFHDEFDYDEFPEGADNYETDDDYER